MVMILKSSSCRKIVILLISTTLFFAKGPEAGFEGEDAFIAIGDGMSREADKGQLQKESSAKQSARIAAESRFAEDCFQVQSAGGGCRELTAELKEIMSLPRGAKVVSSECVEDPGPPAGLHCRVALRISRKNLKAICAKLSEEGGQICH